MKRVKTSKRQKPAPDQELIRFGISIPATLIKKFDQHLSQRQNQNRSEAIRDLIRDRLVQDSWTEGRGEHLATVTLVYESQSLDFQRRLLEAKKALGVHLLSTMQVHLAPHQELEVLVARGPANTIRAEAESILALKGVLHGKVVMTSATA